MTRAVCIAVLFFIACTQYQRAEPRTIETSTTYQDADFDAVWEGVIGAMAELGYPITNMEKASGLIVTDWMRFPIENAYMDCGQPGGLQIMDQPLGRFNIFVREGPPVMLTVNTSYKTDICFGDTCNEVQCASTGILEHDIQQLVRRGL